MSKQAIIRENYSCVSEVQGSFARSACLGMSGLVTDTGEYFLLLVRCTSGIETYGNQSEGETKNGEDRGDGQHWPVLVALAAAHCKDDIHSRVNL